MNGKYDESYKASRRNQIIISKIISATKNITGTDVSAADIYYLKYQLLQQDDSYELSSMNDAEFQSKITAIIGG